MQKDVAELAAKIDGAKLLCQKVLESGEKIKQLSPDEIGMEEYAEQLTRCTEDRGRATRIAIQELGLINGNFEKIENDNAASASDKAFLSEKLRSVRDMSPLFAKQNNAIQKNIATHLNSLRHESVEFHHNVGIIRNYLKAPDKKSFYG